jgi:hypothetical protein
MVLEGDEYSLALQDAKGGGVVWRPNVENPY